MADGTTFCGSCGAPTGAGQPTIAAPVGNVEMPLPPAPAPVASVTWSAVPPQPIAAAPQVAYAGFWLRFVAIIIDDIILRVILGIPALVLIGGTGFFSLMRARLEGGASPDELLPEAMSMAGMIGLFLMLSLIGQWLYFALMESSSWQATLGKKALGLVVTDMSGRRISFARATGRYFGKIVSGLTLLIGFIMAGFTERKQALHDMIASTLVLRKL
jgi:uncharacterized RDD family membrane protein YckC